MKKVYSYATKHVLYGINDFVRDDHGKIMYFATQDQANEHSKDAVYACFEWIEIFEFNVCDDCGVKMLPDNTYIMSDKNICEFCYYSG